MFKRINYFSIKNMSVRNLFPVTLTPPIFKPLLPLCSQFFTLFFFFSLHLFYNLSLNLFLVHTSHLIIMRFGCTILCKLSNLITINSFVVAFFLLLFFCFLFLFLYLRCVLSLYQNKLLLKKF